MHNRDSPLSPDVWLKDLFASQAVQQGAVIRRKLRDVERFAGMDRFLAEVERRGWRAAENGGQIIIFCNREPVRWLTDEPRFLPKKAGRNPSRISVRLARLLAKFRSGGRGDGQIGA